MADNFRLGVLLGDGIGPEIVPAAVQVLDSALAAVGAPAVEWVPLPVGAAAIETHATYRGTGEFMPTADVAIAMGIFTRPAIERIARQAFELAVQRRKHLTVVHKANVLRTTTGFFLEICREIAAEYPDVAVDDFHIDAMTVHLVRHGADFDVLVTENMFGDILSDLTGELAGSLGIAPSINASHERAMAQAAHGSAPDIAGRGLANPTAMIASGAMLLDWLGNQPAAELIDRGLRAAVAQGTRTAHLGGTAGTAEFTAAVVESINGLG